MELKHNRTGAVDFVLLVNGVRVKNQMTDKEAQELINKGKIEVKGNEVIVDNKFVFELEGVEKPEEKAVEKPIEDKPLKEAVKEAKKKPRRKSKKNV